jgi:hypothetical protein
MEITPQPVQDKHKTKDEFVKWTEQKSFGTTKGSLGMKQQTVGKLMNFDDFQDHFKTLQSK